MGRPNRTLFRPATGHRRTSVIFTGGGTTGQTGLRHARGKERHVGRALHFVASSDKEKIPVPIAESPSVHDIALHLLALLFVAAFLAGFIDSIAGGGGMISVPAMLIAGIPPLETLGTNKLQSLFGSASASIAYARRGHVNLGSQLPMAAMSALGAALGALLATIVPGDLLKLVLPFLLIGIALYFAVKPKLDDVDKAQRMTPFLFSLTLVPLIGFYDGVFGPGTGSFFMLAFITLAGFGVLKATAHTKFLNFGSNIGAFAVFAAYGVILWKVGLIMGVGQFIGAQVGSRFAMRNGARIIKPLLVITCIALAIRLLADPAHPLRVWIGW